MNSWKGCLPGTREPDWLRNIMTTRWGGQRKLFPEMVLLRAPKPIVSGCDSIVLPVCHTTEPRCKRNPSVSPWAQRTNDLGSKPTSILWNTSLHFHLSEIGGNSPCSERLFQKEANHTESRTSSAGLSHCGASTSWATVPSYRTNARCYSTVVSPIADTNPKLTAFVSFGTHRTEGGVMARIKIGRLPKQFHKLLGNEMSSNARSAFQCGN